MQLLSSQVALLGYGAVLVIGMLLVARVRCPGGSTRQLPSPRSRHRAKEPGRRFLGARPGGVVDWFEGSRHAVTRGCSSPALDELEPAAGH